MSVTFAKAQAQQAKLKIGLYGPPGSGKTFTALLMAEGLALHEKRRIAYVDTERGTDFYSQPVKERGVHPGAFDFDAIYTRSLADVSEAVRSLDPKTHGVIVLDSVSHLWDSAIEAYEGKRTSVDSIPMHAWGAIKKPYRALIAWLIGSPFHVFILGRQKNVFDTSGDEFRKVGVAMRAEGETEYEPHISMRMEAKKDEKDSRKSVYFALVEKDRTGVLSGRTVANPGFATIQPLLSLLGDVQAPAEDEEERQAKDAALLDAQRDKAEKKGARSGELLAEFQGRIAAAAAVADLGTINNDLKKQKRYITEEHLATLRVLFDQRASVLVAKATGQEVA